LQFSPRLHHHEDITHPQTQLLHSFLFLIQPAYLCQIGLLKTWLFTHFPIQESSVGHLTLKQRPKPIIQLHHVMAPSQPFSSSSSYQPILFSLAITDSRPPFPGFSLFTCCFNIHISLLQAAFKSSLLLWILDFLCTLQNLSKVREVWKVCSPSMKLWKLVMCNVFLFIWYLEYSKLLFFLFIPQIDYLYI
jgi:hypothetical protein